MRIMLSLFFLIGLLSGDFIVSASSLTNRSDKSEVYRQTENLKSFVSGANRYAVEVVNGNPCDYVEYVLAFGRTTPVNYGMTSTNNSHALNSLIQESNAHIANAYALNDVFSCTRVNDKCCRDPGALEGACDPKQGNDCWLVKVNGFWRCAQAAHDC